jgi:translation initiation factor 2 beta subunit (eIF-2beta)/eIF-5
MSQTTTSEDTVDRKLPPEEKNPGFISKSPGFHKDKEPSTAPTTMSKERQIFSDLENNKVSVSKSETREMKIFQETSFDIDGEDKEFQAIRLNSDRTGSNGILKDNGDYYHFNHSQPDSEYNQEEGRWVFKEKISKEVVEEKLESHFENWKLGRSWSPL